MILYDLLGTERHPAYGALAADNLARQYDFLRSVVNAALAINRPMLSSALVKALNYHAISCLHVSAGEYRPCPVTVGQHHPPDHYLVPELMNGFINEVNRFWETSDISVLAAYCLWRLNYIHPFINGNGRTARVLCYFVVCVKSGGWLRGEPILPELILQHRERYVALLRDVDEGFRDNRADYLNDLTEFIADLLQQQVQSISR